MPRIILSVLATALLVIGSWVVPVVASDFTSATEKSEASKRQHGSVTFTKEWDANSPN